MHRFGTTVVITKIKSNVIRTITGSHSNKRFKKPKEDVMKAKTNYSVLLAETTAKGSLAIFAGVAVFLGGFITWSAAGAISGLASLFN
jgi:hypothetical protein